jgi:hypothetical protein
MKGVNKMCYYVRYRMYDAAEVKGVAVAARNKADAHDKAVYEIIPQKEGRLPYSAWVYSVTYNNGKHKLFNTCEGNPY